MKAKQPKWRKALWIPFVINLFTKIDPAIRVNMPMMIAMAVSIYFAFKCLYQGRESLDESLERFGIIGLARYLVILSSACVYWFSIVMWVGPLVDNQNMPFSSPAGFILMLSWMVAAAYISGFTFFEVNRQETKE